MTKKTLNDQDKDEYYGVILESSVLKIEKDIRKLNLCLVLSLYFKVRSHSFAKDIADKHKVIKNNNWNNPKKDYVQLQYNKKRNNHENKYQSNKKDYVQI